MKKEAETAANASLPRKRPTMTLSVKLYTCCVRLPTSSGSAKAGITRHTAPRVKSRAMLNENLKAKNEKQKRR